MLLKLKGTGFTWKTTVCVGGNSVAVIVFHCNLNTITVYWNCMELVLKFGDGVRNLTEEN